MDHEAPGDLVRICGYSGGGYGNREEGVVEEVGPWSTLSGRMSGV